MRILKCHLKNLKAALRTCNFSVFGDLERQIEACLDKLEAIQLEIISVGFSESLHLQELEVHHELDTFLIQQEYMFRKKSCVHWLTGEDHNTAFNQTVVKAKRVHAYLSFLNIKGILTDDANLIEEYVIGFYKG